MTRGAVARSVVSPLAPPTHQMRCSGMTTSVSRRGFLAHSSQSLSAGWLSFQLPWIAVLAGCAREDASRSAPFLHFTPAEGRAMQAFAAQIIPSDDGTPGAEELGAAYFIDRALGTPYFSPNL